MASGCILGTCCRCKKLIWEDEEWEYYYDGIRHANCKEGLYCHHCGELIKESELDA